MMVAIDEARQHDLVAATDDRHLGVVGLEFLEGADRLDDAILLQDRPVRNLLPGLSIDRSRNHRAAADDRLGHDCISVATWNAGPSYGVVAKASCSAKARSTSSLRCAVSSMRSFSHSGEKRLRGLSISIGTIVLMRPGLAVKTTTRSDSATASSIWCVTKSTDAALLRHTSIRKSCIRWRVCTSSAANGSSISNTLGCIASARATATRWRMPPDNSSGRLSNAAERPTRCRASLATVRRSSTGVPRIARPKLTFCHTVSQGKSEVSWKMRLLSGDGDTRRCPNDHSSPAVTASSPAIR